MNKLTEPSDKVTQELSDDMEVIGPGQMLLEGRKALGLSQEDVAKRLNFHLSLVESIESENFDKKLPNTFNRGYLRSFAKMVNISQEDVLASYDMLDIAAKQGAEMQSFSQNTKKQAEHSRLMWISYLVVAILIGSTVFWFFQENTSFEQTININPPQEIKPTITAKKVNDIAVTQKAIVVDEVVEVQPVSVEPIDVSVNEVIVDIEASTDIVAVQEETAVVNNSVASLNETNVELAQVITVDTKQPIDFKFVFSGDCWVNIYDAAGERVAYGVKKKGYIMNFKGLAPLNVTVARPEFVTITYQSKDQEQAVELSQFAAGNIAKFTLPLATN